MEGVQSSSNAMKGDPISKKTPPHLDVVYIRDFPFPASARFNKENILSALDYSPLDDDLIISSYPKTGATWVEYIILQILHRGEIFPTMVELNHKLVPFMERIGAAAAERLNPPRFIKFHFPYHLIPYNSKAKYIYVIRNPKDVVVSFYHFRREMGDHEVSFDEFFDYFLSGQVPYGDYLEHLKSWIPHKDDDNVLFVCYEKLHSDVKKEILRIARFLGENYYEPLSKDDELLSKILKKTSFDYMMKNLTLKRPLPDVNAASSKSEQKTVRFFRKGVPGDWKNYLSPEQSRLLDNKMDEMLGEGELLNLWKS